MTLKMEQIKTYSKMNPITPYASSAELVKIEQNAKIDTISESKEDCEKTLEIDIFENTFDRLAAGVVVPTPKKSYNHSTSCEESDQSANNDSYEESKQVNLFETTNRSLSGSIDESPEFKFPEIPKKRHNLRERILKQESLKNNTVDKMISLRKRKQDLCYNENNEEDDLPRNKRPKLKEVFGIKKCSVPIIRWDGSNNINSVVTSTPLGRRIKRKMYAENISPIQKSNFPDSEDDDDEVEPTSILEKSVQKHCRPIYDIRVVVEKLQTNKNEDSLLKLKSKLSDIVSLHCDESINQSLKDGKPCKPPNLKIITESNEILIKPIDVNEDVITATISCSRNINSPSFIGTPSMSFGESSVYENEKVKNTCLLGRSIEKVNALDESVLADLSNSLIHEEGKLNESSYYPHEWTNDYESTCVYFGEKTSSSDKENENTDAENYLNQSAQINSKNVTSQNMDLEKSELNFKNIIQENEKLPTDVESIKSTIDDSVLFSKNDEEISTSKLSEVYKNLENNLPEPSIEQNIVNKDDQIAIFENLKPVDTSVENSCIQDILSEIEMSLEFDSTNASKNINKSETSIENKEIKNAIFNDSSFLDSKKPETLISKTTDVKTMETKAMVEESSIESFVDNLENSTSLSKPTLCAEELQKNENSEETSMNETSNNNDHSNNSNDTEDQDLHFLLSQLKNPISITINRNKYRNWSKQLDPIAEDLSSKEQNKEMSITLDNENNEISVKKISEVQNLSTNEEFVNLDRTEDNDSVPKEKVIFLKPGKSWARSLSILNNFNSKEDIDKASLNRGKSWRHSVQSILSMQPEGIKNAETVHSQSPELKLKKENNIRISSNHNRMSRHFSMRIVPSGISSITNYIDENTTQESCARETRKSSFNRISSTTSFRRHTIIATEEDLINSAKDIVLKRCCQTKYLPFSVVFPNPYLKCCRKIGEGVYGEVFLYENDSEKSVIKIIPIEGDLIVNSEPQKKFHEILSEVIITEELHKLRDGHVYSTSGFVGVITTKCIIGKYPKKLLQIWDKYDQEKESENDCPKMFGKDQLYIVLELVHGGQDLESYIFQNASESLSIFYQTALSLAVGEKSLEFEHRDLHWGNILISTTEEKYIKYKLNEKEIKVPSKGVKVSLIDFTLSRMSYHGCRIFNDLSTDPTLFTAQGEYQFDIYRKMRESLNNDWQQYNPHTNILWLDYTLDKMIKEVQYKRKYSKLHRTSVKLMEDLRKEIFTYKSAFDFVTKCEKISGISGLDNN